MNTKNISNQTIDLIARATEAYFDKMGESHYNSKSEVGKEIIKTALQVFDDPEKLKAVTKRIYDRGYVNLAYPEMHTHEQKQTDEYKDKLAQLQNDADASKAVISELGLEEPNVSIEDLHYFDMVVNDLPRILQEYEIKIDTGISQHKQAEHKPWENPNHRSTENKSSLKR